MPRKAVNRPVCREAECFQNTCGILCDLLTESPSQPCPFKKTKLEAEIGKLEAHQKLVNAGRWDLIEEYEHNPQRGRQW